MQLLDGTYVYSATDLNNYLECKHLIALSRRAANHELIKPDFKDPTAELVANKGNEHEAKWLAEFVAYYGAERVVNFDQRVENTTAGLAAGEARTLAAMASGASMIYQGTFFDGTFLGHADFLRRVERPSALGSWSYEVIDTKLALSPKPYFLIQLCNYSEHLKRLQGIAPENGYVVFGSDIERPFKIASYAAYYRHLKASFLEWVAAARDAYPLEVSHCSVCAWTQICERKREADDHLSLVAGIRRDQIAKIEEAGFATMTALATATQRPNGMRDETFQNVRTQASLQVLQRKAIAAGDTRPYRYTFRTIEPSEDEPRRPEETGFGRLPEPARGDIFFDIEGDPLYRPDRGLEYLFGIYVPDEDEYIAFWARDATQERGAFERCVDFISDRLKHYPDLHVYHYAPYERTALGRLMGTFASRENEIDRFFTIGLFVDLYPIVRQSMWISQPSYSLKKVEAFYDWIRTTKTRGGDDSIVMFESWLASGDDAILDDIERYNEDDCRSTYGLREWLVARRDEYNRTLESAIPWRASRSDAPVPEAVERTALETALLEGIEPPFDLGELDRLPEFERERWLIGNLLQYHRRENKPAYWEYFQRCERIDELAEFDRKAIGGLRPSPGFVPRKLGERDRNLVYAFTYPPQEHDLGSSADCADAKKSVKIVSHDEDARVIELKLSVEIAAILTALIPGKPLPHGQRQEGIERIATALLNGSLDLEHPATSALLRRALPRFIGTLPGLDIQPEHLDAASITASIASLDRSYLFIQGPPGSGKSTYGAEAVVALLNAGRRVGLMANGHKALHGLLHKIEEIAVKKNVGFTGVHKMSSTENSEYVSFLADPMIRSANSVAPGDGNLVSGTAYFWPDGALVKAFDTIFIDEAGQVPLADALNAAMAANNVVLLGDPQQLPNVQQGSHPVGAGRSILEHLLEGHDTVPPDRGIFLDVSYRMQPELADFVSATSYEGRLHAGPKTANNRIDSSGLRGGGLAYIGIEHLDNGRISIEEAERIVIEVRALLLDGTFVKDDAPPKRLTETDILIVAPYNAQRRTIRRLLDDAGFADVAVGTVDKFQGQEAPVVFYSMATSTDEDLPRDMAFLFDRNRFNVAISRAQCLSVLVCSPRLLDARCRNPEQMELVNLLCGFVERATPV